MASSVRKENAFFGTFNLVRTSKKSMSQVLKLSVFWKYYKFGLWSILKIFFSNVTKLIIDFL